MASVRGYHQKSSPLRRVFERLLGASDQSRALVPEIAKRRPPPSDWVAPQKTLVLVGSHRSGSTLLCSLMAQTDRLGKPDEFFKRVPYPHWQLAEDTVEGRCRAAASIGKSSNGICGLKLFPAHMGWLQNEISLFDWFPEPQFVWIRRRDLLGQSISGVIARQTKQYRCYSKDRGIEAEYSALQIAEQLQRFAFDEACWRTYFARTGNQPHEVFYEDLVDAPAEVMGRLGRSIGVEIDPQSLSINDSGLAVQRSEINAEWRRRYLSEQGNPNLIQLQFISDL